MFKQLFFAAKEKWVILLARVILLAQEEYIKSKLVHLRCNYLEKCSLKPQLIKDLGFRVLENCLKMESPLQNSKDIGQTGSRKNRWRKKIVF
jgi:hypothetical protein